MINSNHYDIDTLRKNSWEMVPGRHAQMRGLHTPPPPPKKK